MSERAFETILLLGRPAAGKSEVLDYLKKTPVEDRLNRFHIGDFREIDDFPYIWDSFETDEIMSQHGKPRLFSDKDRYFLDDFLWDFYIEKLNLDYRKLMAAEPDYFKSGGTLLVEFARGGEDGFRRAFKTLDPDIVRRAVVLYIKVPFEESLRKNQRRARPGLEHSILHHSLPEHKLRAYYTTNDWDAIDAADPQFIDVPGVARMPYGVFDNLPEKTHDPALLASHLEEVCQRLWGLHKG